MARSARHEQTTAPDRFAIQYGVAVWTFTSADPQGREDKVPTFWAGDNIRRVRYALRVVGRQTYGTISTDFDESLQGQRGEPVASAYSGDNPLRKHGFILPYAAEIPGEVRAVFMPPTPMPPTLQNLESDVKYGAFYFNPATGKPVEIGIGHFEHFGNRASADLTHARRLGARSGEKERREEQ